jgi:hypothetical protein
MGGGQQLAEMQSSEMIGATRNLSEIGLAISVPSNQIDHRYLNVVGCKLDLTLNLPTGPIQMQATTRWCKKLLEEEAGEGYLIGLRITKMGEPGSLRPRIRLANPSAMLPLSRRVVGFRLFQIVSLKFAL